MEKSRRVIRRVFFEAAVREHIHSTILAGLRGRSVHAVFALGIFLLAFSYLAADLSPRQPQAVALDVGLSFMRFNLALLAIFWVQELVGKEFERRTVLVAFAYPTGRASYIVGRYLGISWLLAVASLILGGFLAAVTYFSAHGYEQIQPVQLGFPFGFAVFGIFVDSLVVAAFTLAVATLSTVSLLPLALGGLFAIATRSFGPVFQYLRKGADGDSSTVERFNPLLEMIQWVLPDLSRLDWRYWPLYQLPPSPEAIFWPLVLAFSYLTALVWLSVRIASHREIL